jgi:hypothetical protein
VQWNNSAWWTWLNVIFNAQSDFYNAATANMTANQVIAAIGTLANQKVGTH